MAIQSFRDLQAWQLGMEYVLAIYAVTEEFPRDERYGLTSQLRRAAVAIPSDISEGHVQGTRTYLRYVVIAMGSVAECETQIEIARRLNYARPNDFTHLDTIAGDLRRVLFGLRRSLRRKTRGVQQTP
ncbi:MAG: four helix bundle protein [Vicinamibacterales bacterium]